MLSAKPQSSSNYDRRVSRRAAVEVLTAAAISTGLAFGPLPVKSAPEVSTSSTSSQSGVVTTASGLRYYDFPLPDATSNAEKVSSGDKVRFHLTTGTTGARNGWIIDSTRGEGRDALVVVAGAGDVVAGLDEALVGISVGGKRRAVVPPNLGYVREGMQPAVKGFAETQRFRNLFYNKDRQYIPDVVFDIEVLKILKKAS